MENEITMWFALALLALASFAFAFPPTCTVTGYSGVIAQVILNCTGLSNPARALIATIAFTPENYLSGIDNNHTVANYMGLIASDGTGNGLLNYILPLGMHGRGIYTIGLSSIWATLNGGINKGFMAMANTTGGLWADACTRSHWTGVAHGNGYSASTCDPTGWYYCIPSNYIDSYGTFTWDGLSNTWAKDGGSVSCSQNTGGFRQSYYLLNSTGGYIWDPNIGGLSFICTTGDHRCLGSDYQTCTSMNLWNTTMACSPLCPVSCAQTNISSACNSNSPPRCLGADYQVCNDATGFYYTQTPCSVNCQPNVCYGTVGANFTIANLDRLPDKISVQATKLLDNSITNMFTWYMAGNNNLTKVMFRIIDRNNFGDFAPALKASDFNVTYTADGLLCTGNFNAGNVVLYPVYTAVGNVGCSFLGANTTGSINLTVNVHSTYKNPAVNLQKTFLVYVEKPQLYMSEEQFYYTPNDSSTDNVSFKANMYTGSMEPVYDNLSCVMSAANVSSITNGIEIYNPYDYLQNTVYAANCTQNGNRITCFVGTFDISYRASQFTGTLFCNSTKYTPLTDKSGAGLPIPKDYLINSIRCAIPSVYISNDDAQKTTQFTSVCTVVPTNPSVLTPDKITNVRMQLNMLKPEGYKLINLMRMDVPAHSPSGVWKYSLYILAPLDYSDDISYPIADNSQAKNGVYVYTGSVAYLFMPTPQQSAFGSVLAAATYYQKNLHVTVSANGVDYDVYAVNRYDVMDSMTNSLRIGNATVVSSAMASGDTLECQAVIDDPHRVLSSISAYVVADDGTRYDFSQGTRQGQYSLTYQVNNPSGSATSRWDTIARLIIPNFGGCLNNLSSAGMCNASVSNYTFGKSGSTTRFGCVITAVDINGNSVDSVMGFGQFTNTLKTPYSNLTMNIDVGGFLAGIIKWMFASVENLLVSLFIFLAFVAGMPVIYLILEKGWTLMGGKGEGGGAVQIAPEAG